MKIANYTFSKGQWSHEFDQKLDSTQTVVFVFCDSEIDLNSKAFVDLKDHFSKSKILGCSSAGCIANEGIIDESISISVVQFDHTELKLISLPINYDNSYSVGQDLSQKLDDKNLNSIFFFSEGLNVNGSELAKSINDYFQKKQNSVTVLGGLAGGKNNFKKTFVISNGEIKSNHVVSLGLYGSKVFVTTNTGGGWDVFGPHRKITKSKDNVVYELDQQPALEIYKKYLKNEAQNLPYSGLFFPLSVKQSGKKSVVRTLISTEEKDSSLTFLATLEPQSTVQVMYSNLLMLINGAKDAFNESRTKLKPNIESFVLIVSCVGRRMVMGQKTEDEIEVIKDLMPEKSNLSGYYSNGEIAATESSICELHNQTMTFAIIQENP